MLPEVRINEIAGVQRIVHPEKSSYKRDWAAYALTIKKIGSTVYETASGSYTTDQRHILLLRKGLSCIIHPELGECITIEFEGDFSEKLPEVTSFKITNNVNSIAIFDRMEEKWASKGISYRNTCMSGLYQIFSLMEQDNYIPETCVPNKQIQPSIDYMETNYGDPELDNEDLARSANLSVSHFRKLFREALNKSPMAYLRTVRINKAKELLSVNGMNITRTSEMTGFASPFYFDVVFRKETGMTPTDFVRRAGC